MSNVIELVTPNREREARADLLRLEKVKPSEAAPLTDEDLAIFGMFLQQNERQFSFFVKAAYLDYFTFFSGAVARVATEAAEVLGDRG